MKVELLFAYLNGRFASINSQIKNFATLWCATTSILLLFTGCIPSPPPEVSDLIKMATPSFGGLTTKNFTTPSQTFTLSGECDKLAHSVEFALGTKSYTQIADKCPDGTFTKTVTLIEGYTEIRVRAKGKFNYSDEAIAKVNFVLPPTAPYHTMVQSSASDHSDLAGWGTQNTMGLNITGQSSSSSSHRMEVYLPGVVYGR